MAGLHYYTPVLYELYPYTLSAGETLDVGIVYETGMSTLSYLTVDSATALNVQFTISDTVVVVNGLSEDSPPSNTTYWITVTNGDSENTVEFGVRSWTVFS
jgi:hypothetical protein